MYNSTFKANKAPQQYLQQGAQPKLKINNSYESEPSTGSGSSLSENNDCNVSDDENMNMKAPLLINELAAEISATSKSTKTSLNSSQDSPFRGFVDIPFDKRQRTYKKKQSKTQTALTSSQESSFLGFPSSPESKSVAKASQKVMLLSNNLKDSTAGKLTFPRFYDILLENSCNAVDMQLPQANIANKVDANVETKLLDLSFDGKIKSLTASSVEKADLIDVKTDTSSLKPRQSTLTDDSYISHNVKSPDLFGDDEDDEEDDDNLKVAEKEEINAVESEDAVTMMPLEQISGTTANLDFTKLLQWNLRCEREMLRRMRKCLSGIPPPPSHTILQLNLFEEIAKKKEDILQFFNEIPQKTEQNGIKTDDFSNSPTSTSSNIATKKCISLLKPTHTLQETQAMDWKNILAVRQQGLHYNLSKASEANDYLSLALVERFVGGETASSHCPKPNSAKKRQSRLKMLTQSPGSRLSHLAKRRSVFSSANLANTSQKSFGPQILVDRVKTKARRRGTPNSKKKRKTPSSSARKRLQRCDLKKPGPTRETSKRALFQSPAKQIKNEIRAPVPRPLQIKPEIATRLEKSKRALFSPDNSQSSQTLFALDQILKRKRNDVDGPEDDETLLTQSNKLFHGSHENITPRSLKIKSQSFCIGAASLNNDTLARERNQNNPAQNNNLKNLQLNSGNILQRAQSETTVLSHSLTENQRKKLLWAVSQALQEKKISTKHEKFRDFAAVLARVVRRIFQEFYQRTSTSNSETMLKLSKKYAFAVISGRQADEIYIQAKGQIEECARLSRFRFTGYIGPAEYEQRKLEFENTKTTTKTVSLQNMFVGDSSIDSCCWSGSSQRQLSQTSLNSDVLLQQMCSKNTLFQNETEEIALQQPIQSNPALQNSSSKNNLGFVLRENVLDPTEQRRSAQKKSPFAVTSNAADNSSSTNKLLGSGCKLPSQMLSSFNLNCARAKRNISFE